MVRAANSRAAKAEPQPEKEPDPDLTDEAKAIFGADIESIGGIYVDAKGEPLGLFARLAKIMENLPDVEPAGKNDHFKYKFLTNTQITGLLRPRLAKQGILIFPEKVTELEPKEMTTARGGRSLLTRLHVVFKVVDSIAGETFTGEVIGYGDDSGDKGANKAYTAALKNFLIKLFLIGGDSDDLEADEDADKRAKAREAGSERVSRVDIGDADITGVKRGGRSEKATDAQVARVGQYIRDLQMMPQAFVTFVDSVLGDNLDIEEDPEPWVAIKRYLEDLSGKDIGKLVARFDALMNATDQQARDDADLDENRD